MCIYDKYKDITFEDFEKFVDNNWTYLYPEHIDWYIRNDHMIKKYWHLWKPYVILNIIIETLDTIERRNKDICITHPPRVPENWHYKRYFPGYC